MENVIETDVLVVGGGMSGIWAAIKAREEGVEVTLAEKAYVGHAGSVFYAEGFYIVFNPQWGHNLKDWLKQIAIAGDYMNNPEWTEVALRDSYDRYRDLQSWGVKFQKGKDGSPLVFRRGVLESQLFGEGWTWLPSMRGVIQKSGVKILDRTMITDLLTDDGRVVGAVGFNVRDGEFYVLKAKATVICTQGGMGETMAYRAGAEISSKEFVGGGVYRDVSGMPGQAKEGAPKVSLEGKDVKSAPAGGWDGGAQHYIDRYVDADGNRINRSTIAPAVHEGRAPILWNLDDATIAEISDDLHEIETGGTAFKVQRSGFDVTKGGLNKQVAGSRGNMGGSNFAGGSGIWSTDLEGGTNIPGLYAAGEAYNSREVGASYPWWGFSLHNCSVTGTRAGRAAAAWAREAGKVVLNADQIARLKSSVYAPLQRVGGFDANWVNTQIRNITGSYYIWLVRHGDRLKAALTLMEFLEKHIEPLVYVKGKDPHGLMLAHEAKSRILSTEMALRAAIFRTESRGRHYREDYPHRDDPNWLAAVKIGLRDGEMELVKEPLPQKWWPDLSIPYGQRYPMKYVGEE